MLWSTMFITAVCVIFLIELFFLFYVFTIGTETLLVAPHLPATFILDHFVFHVVMFRELHGSCIHNKCFHFFSLSPATKYCINSCINPNTVLKVKRNFLSGNKTSPPVIGPLQFTITWYKKPPCWRANYPLGHPKQSNLT